MSDTSSYRFTITLPRRIQLQGRTVAREDFYAWAWKEFTCQGLQGVHEGTLLSAEAAAEGLETESWTVDAGEAPRDRDWLRDRETAEAEFYFASREGALAAVKRLQTIPEVTLGPVLEQEQQDWDAQWKASFLGSAKGVRIPPFWRVLPPWVSLEEAELSPGEVVLRINPGAGFGTGTHETTQLCLDAIGQAAGAAGGLQGREALDFGSGSGILAIGAALLGARVDAVEIDPLAIDNARENARLNSADERITYSLDLDSLGPAKTYGLVIANILRPVLIQFSTELVRRMAPKGRLILSGLIDKDVAEVSMVFGKLLGGRKPRVSELGEWRSVVFE